jgi:integrase
MPKTSLPKTDLRYWRTRVFKPVSVRSDQRIVADYFAVKLQAAGKRKALSLHTANREEAEHLAKRMYQDLLTLGWDKFLAQYRPLATPEPVRKELLTIGQFLAQVRAKDLLAPRTLDGYAMRFRGMAAEIAGIPTTNRRYRSGSKAHQDWLAKIDALPLANITPASVRQWKQDRLAQAQNPVERKHTLASVNSTMRQARGLFSERKVLRFIEILRPHPFAGVEVDAKTDARFFGAGINAAELLRRGVRELAKEELKAFLLSLALGLRRLEADHLEWDSFDFDRSTVQIKATEFYSLKTEKSAAVLSLDPEIMALFRGWHAQHRGPFVLESDKPPRQPTHHPYYRADTTFNKLISWLQRQRAGGTKPLHTLRKMYGSLIAEKHGLFAASATLRHSSISTTTEHYLDHAVTATSGLGSVLSGAAVLPFPSSPATAPRPRLSAPADGRRPADTRS